MDIKDYCLELLKDNLAFQRKQKRYLWIKGIAFAGWCLVFLAVLRELGR